MHLPGGILMDGERRRSFRFHAVSGRLELALAESESVTSLPARVSAVLAISLAELGGREADLELVRELCVGDRQFLMQELARELDGGPLWLSATCGGCGEPFDVEVERAGLPVKPAGVGYPEREVEISVGPVTVRVPTGADQERIAGLDAEEASTELWRRLVRGPLTADVALSDDDRARIEAAAEELSPEVADAALVECPSCGVASSVALEPYEVLLRRADELFGEIHTLALHYHWSEDDILALPRERRRVYLHWIDRGRGQYGASEFLTGAEA